MVLRTHRQIEIESVRNHSEETVERLRRLVISGAAARPDANRSDFFEIEDGNQVFYIHISPVNGKFLLLATWARENVPELDATPEYA